MMSHVNELRLLTHERVATMSDKRARWAVGAFGDSSESGGWQPGTKTRAVAVFGDSTLDMRGAITAGDEITVRAVAGFGDVRVMVPAGSRVEISGLALPARHGRAGRAWADGPAHGTLMRPPGAVPMPAAVAG